LAESTSESVYPRTVARLFSPINVALALVAVFAFAATLGAPAGIWLTMAAASAFALSGSA